MEVSGRQNPEGTGARHGQGKKNTCFGIGYIPKNRGRRAIFPNIFSVGDFSA
jgi:hypothetical protein